MPGETFSCIGCHESRGETWTPAGIALAGEAQPLATPLGIENQGFDYPRFVQPILDEHCAACHTADHPSGFDLTGDLVYDRGARKWFARSYISLMQGIGRSRRNRAINIASIFSQAPQVPPYSYGSTRSGMIRVLTDEGDANHRDVNLSVRELKTLACWIDLEVPHSGSCDSYVARPDAQRYRRLEANAQRWYEIEAENIKRLAER